MKARGIKNYARTYQILMGVFFVLFFSFCASQAVGLEFMWIAGPLFGVLALQIVAELAWKTGRSNQGALRMALVAYDPCGTTLATFTPAGDCLAEGTGILGFLLVKKGFDLNTVIDATTYADAKTAANLKVIKDLEAFWPAVNPVTQPGFSGRTERLAYINYELPFKHEGINANLVFWNTLNQSRNWGVAFVTEDYKAYAPLDRNLEAVLCSFFAAPGGEQEFGKTANMSGMVRWKSKDLPQYLDLFTPAILKADFQP
jgi:hypothetical protein